jgi:hypothetical protein
MKEMRVFLRVSWRENVRQVREMEKKHGRREKVKGNVQILRKGKERTQWLASVEASKLIETERES